MCVDVLFRFVAFADFDVLCRRFIAYFQKRSALVLLNNTPLRTSQRFKSLPRVLEVNLYPPMLKSP